MLHIPCNDKKVILTGVKHGVHPSGEPIATPSFICWS